MTPAPPAAVSPGVRRPVVWAGAITLAAVLIRLVGLDRRWLWYDEILSATFGAHDLWNTIVTNLRFDVHPPIYYLQLTAWEAFGRGDQWLMLNSVAWSAAAALILILVARRPFGDRAALIAGALLAAAPPALVFGDQVRMYAFLMVMLIWAWRAQAAWVGAESPPDQRLETFLSVIVSQSATVYSHSAGLIMISGVVLFGFCILAARGDLANILRLAAIESVVAVLAIPAVGIALAREVGHTVSPSLGDYLQTARFLGAGDLAASWWGAGLGLMLAVVLLYLFVCKKPLRLGLATLVFAPLVIAAVVSHLLKPIWLDRIFAPIVPFVCLYIALGLAPRPQAGMASGRVGRILLSVFALCWVAAGLAGQAGREKGDGFKPLASYTHAAAKPGDLVLVDGDYAFWCFLWYFDGPDWGVPQQAYLMTAKWAGLVSRLPASAQHAFGFDRDQRRIDVDGVTAMLWDRSAPQALPAAGDVFLVRPIDSPAMAFKGRTLADARQQAPLIVERWRRSPTAD